MITIYGDASNINLTAQKRHLRVVEGQTQATPYAGYLDPSLRNADGSFRLPAATDTLPLARSEAAYSYFGGLIPGTVLVKTTGENFTVHNGDTTAAVEPFGLLGQFVGGTIDGVKSTNEVAAWFGPDSVYDLLAPAWNDTGLAAAIAASTAGKAVKLYAGKDGRLTYIASPGSSIAVATVVERPSSAVLRIKLLV
jgi:hypothetical protein